MFERYTMSARRVLFFARYEASEFGSPNIGTEHLLLGLLREGKWLMNRLLPEHAPVPEIRATIEQRTPAREKIPTSLDLPLSGESKRVLAYAAEEADQVNHTNISTGHLLLGMLREDTCLAAEILRDYGLTLDKIRPRLKDRELEVWSD